MITSNTKSYLKQALNIEHIYEDGRITGLMYCMYKTPTLLNLEIKDMMELFEMHDQIFILDEHEVYKLHVTKEMSTSYSYISLGRGGSVGQK